MKRIKVSREHTPRRILKVLAVYGVLVAALVGFLNPENPDPDAGAIVYMGLSLIAIWCVLGGAIMYTNRARFVRWARSLEIVWKVRFVLLSIGFALIEEAVTTSLTNLAPHFGAVSAAARITVSTNYFVTMSNSVLAFIPWFICWAWMLGRYDFKPLEVMLLFGLTGLFAESTLDSIVNPEDLAGIGMWVYIYGLIVYLPALTVPQSRDVKPVRWYHIPVAVFLPMVFIFPLGIYLIAATIGRFARGLRAILLPSTE
ncbi:MAG: hypothetical protein P1P76_04005 [Anaerolineales bacterium]|nr:hypothetical protein [Anaerolineales bacterium]